MPCGSVNFSLTLVHCAYEVEMHALCFCQLLIDLSALCQLRANACPVF